MHYAEQRENFNFSFDYELYTFWRDQGINVSRGLSAEAISSFPENSKMPLEKIQAMNTGFILNFLFNKHPIKDIAEEIGVDEKILHILWKAKEDQLGAAYFPQISTLYWRIFVGLPLSSKSEKLNLTPGNNE